MSLETWKAEFYPKDASATEQSDAIAHSLRKWIGLRRENRERHGLVQARACIGEPGTDKGFEVAQETCSLCHHFFNEEISCGGCPLFELRGVTCDERTGSGNEISPYHAFTVRNDPEPMIALLEKALARQKEIECNSTKSTDPQLSTTSPDTTSPSPS